MCPAELAFLLVVRPVDRVPVRDQVAVVGEEQLAQGLAVAAPVDAEHLDLWCDRGPEPSALIALPPSGFIAVHELSVLDRIERLIVGGLDRLARASLQVRDGPFRHRGRLAEECDHHIPRFAPGDAEACGEEREDCLEPRTGALVGHILG